MLSKRLMSLLLTALLLGESAMAAMPPDFRASYELTRGSMKIGNSSIELSISRNGSYTYKSRSWPVHWVAWFLKDKLNESSKGKITEQGIRPDRYSYQRTGGSTEREAKLFFDWEDMTVENNVEDSRWKMDIPAGTLDKLVSHLGMMYELDNGETDIKFNVADGGKLKEFRFRVVGEETIEVPAGSFRTVKVSRLRDNSKRETFFWCAPALHFLPVRIRQREKDDSEYQSDLESYSSSPGKRDDVP
jgi:Protein of unknown function (DUF3108)